MCSSLYRNLPSLLFIYALLLITPPLLRAETGSDLSRPMEEITVTARKREESAQSVPVAISVITSEEIEATKLNNLTDLATGLPNVALDDVGTSPGTANFSIRGLGTNSSIPSIEPTVALFVDGIYMGVNAGVLFDTFDLESIQVLRGPQGTLFGHNATGGAVLVQTKRPPEEFNARIRTSLEGGGEAPYSMTTASIGGPLSDNVRSKLVLHYGDDQGWFKNQATGEAFGENRYEMARSMISWDIQEDLSLDLRYEYQETDGDGPANQSHRNGSGVANPSDNFERDSFDFAIDQEGYQRTRTNFLVSELNWQVPFGDGTVTNISGWRTHTLDILLDADATSSDIIHSLGGMDTEQISNELRYSGTFDERWQLTTGIYYLTNRLQYHERRYVLTDYFASIPPSSGGPFPPMTFDGGGDYHAESVALFGQTDYKLTPELILTAGARLTRETKSAQITSLVFNINNPCNVLDNTCPVDFDDEKVWTNLSPKLGLSYQYSPDVLVYGHWSRAYRSGGYNLRNTSDVEPPSAFDEEQIDNVEAGIKWQWSDRGYMNLAAFIAEIQNLQREVVRGDNAAGVIQMVKNTADARISGVEMEMTQALTPSLRFFSSLGYVDNEYTKVRYDLNGDGQVDAADKSLQLPRAAAWTYSVGLNHEYHITDWGYLDSRISYAFRDESYFSDDNLGYIEDQKMLNAGLDFHSLDGQWQVGLYGKNLLNSVKHGADAQQPATIGPVPLGGTFAPLAKGRVYGMSVTYSF